MQQHISSLYRKIVPEKTRKVIYKAFLGNLLMFIRDFSGTMKWYRCKLYYSIFSPKDEIGQAYKAWGIAGNPHIRMFGKKSTMSSIMK